MSDTARALKVIISSSYDPQGSKQAADGFEKVGESGKKAGEGIFESHREVHKLLHTIGNEAIPGMGQALGALAHGPLGAIIAVSLAVEFLKKGIEDTNKKLDELSANASKAFGGGDSLTNYVKAVAEAATQTEALAEALKKASDAGPEIKNRYEGEAKALKEIVDALKAKLKAQEENDLAEAKKAGASPEVAAATEAEIRARYESQSGAAESAAAQALQQARKNELAERQGNQGPLNAAAAETITPDHVIQTRAGRASELAAQEAALAKATSEMNTEANDKLKEEIESQKQALEFGKKAHGDSDPLGLVKKMRDEVDRLESETAEGRAAAAKRTIEQLSAQIVKDTENATNEKSARDEATNAMTENAKRVVALQKEIAEANTAAAIKAESISQLVNDLRQKGSDTQTFERTAGVDTAGGAADFIRKFLAAQSRLAQHHGTQGDSQMVTLLNQVLNVTKQADQRTYLLLQDLIKHKGDLNAALAELASQTRNASTMRGSTTGQ